MNHSTHLALHDKPIAQEALLLATRHHQGIFRKYGGGQYIGHPIRVAEMLLSYGFTCQYMLAAAFLHDCREDEDVDGKVMPAFKIEDACGAKVLRWVELLSTHETGNRATRKGKAAVRIAGAPWQVQAIKLADVMDNCKGVSDVDASFAQVYVQEKQRMLKKIRTSRLGRTRDIIVSKMISDCDQILTDELNGAALFALETGQALAAEDFARDEEIADIIASEERSVFSEAGMF